MAGVKRKGRKPPVRKGDIPLAPLQQRFWEKQTVQLIHEALEMHGGRPASVHSFTASILWSSFFPSDMLLAFVKPVLLPLRHGS